MTVAAQTWPVEAVVNGVGSAWGDQNTKYGQKSLKRIADPDMQVNCHFVFLIAYVVFGQE